MFIYYSFCVLDESIELFSTCLSLEKGALGLLFELNIFLGAFLAIYMSQFVLRGQAELPAEHRSLEYFIKF